MNAEQEMEAWQHWREACALSLISEGEKTQLTTVISQRFRSMLRKVNLHGRGQLSAPPESDCAHLFETYCAMHQRRDGKKYKHWLLTRGRRDLDTVQSGVMLLIRNVVREWIRHTYPQTAAVSLQQVVGKGSRPVTIEQLLPDTAGESRTKEQTAWMDAQVQYWLGALDPLKQAVLKLRAKGIVFSAPGVKAQVGYGKTALHQCHREWIQMLAEEVRERFPGISAEEGSSLVLDLMDELGHKKLLHSFAEKSSTSAFGEVEVNDDAK
ncbi:hypothetical protein P0Y35_11555 [Kiritimatiellaeota bacterium B1221]|nr:hypothetical protein [Kiritimatiellaeota bacterium B1221]